MIRLDIQNTSSNTAPPHKDQHRGGHTLCRVVRNSHEASLSLPLEITPEEGLASSSRAPQQQTRYPRKARYIRFSYFFFHIQIGNAPSGIYSYYDKGGLQMVIDNVKSHRIITCPWADQCVWQRMTRMTGPDCAVMCNLINTHTHTHNVHPFCFHISESGKSWEHAPRLGTWRLPLG